MKLEGVGAVAVGDLSLEVGGKVDDVDGFERAPASAPSALRGEGRSERRRTSWGRYRIQYRAPPR